MRLLKQILTTIALAGFLFVSSARADGCEVSKRFELKKLQHLFGVLKDPPGDPIYGFQLDLLKDGKTILSRTTDNNGAYDFGEVPPGKYKLRLSQGGKGSGFCAPAVKCTDAGCKISSTAKLGTPTTVVM